MIYILLAYCDQVRKVIYLYQICKKYTISFIFEEVEIKIKSKLIKMQILNEISWIIDPNFKDRRLMYKMKKIRTVALRRCQSSFCDFEFVLRDWRWILTWRADTKRSFPSTTCLNSNEYFYQIFGDVLQGYMIS